MYLPEALGCTTPVTLRSNSLKEKGAIDLEEAEEEECTPTAVKDWKKESYYTKAIGASKLYGLSSSHQKG